MPSCLFSLHTAPTLCSHWTLQVLDLLKQLFIVSAICTWPRKEAVITKYEIAELSGKAYVKTMIAVTIQSALNKAGIDSFDPSKALADPGGRTRCAPLPPNGRGPTICLCLKHLISSILFACELYNFFNKNRIKTCKNLTFTSSVNTFLESPLLFLAFWTVERLLL